MTERTIDDAFKVLARIEINAGSNVALIQQIVKDLTPHLSVSQRGAHWFACKDALSNTEPPCGIPVSPAAEDYDTPLTWALRTLRGDL